MNKPVDTLWSREGEDDDDDASPQDLSDYFLSGSECQPPSRDPLVSKRDKARVFASLFGGVAAAVKLDNRFMLLERIGRGAMGEVYAAYDERLDRRVAIKLVHRSGAVAARADDRLLREGRTLAKLNHPNVVQVHDTGTYDGRVYVAMEYVRGQTLTRWLANLADTATDRRSHRREVLRIFAEAGHGLQAAHRKGLVHRDFKPDNVLIGDDGRARVVDFGLARQVVATPQLTEGGASAGDSQGALVVSTEDATLPADDSESADAPPIESTPESTPEPTPELKPAWVLTRHGQVLGTPRFMSPEQWRGEPADSRSDQFSFCVALWTALYGEPPFAGRGVAAVKEAVLAGDITEPPRGADDSGAEARRVRQALRRGLSVDPAERFADMGELLVALAPASSGGRRGMLGLAAVAVIASGLTVWALQGGPEPCADATAEIDAVWNDSRSGQLRDAFARSGVPDADEIWGQVERRLDAYAERLHDDSANACQVAHRDARSRELIDRRAICLDGARVRLDKLADGLADPDASAVHGALAAADELPDLDACGDDKLLRYGVEAPPADKRQDVAMIRDRLAVARTEELLGHHDAALAIARAQNEAADALGYSPVQAEARYQLGRLLIRGSARADIARGQEFLRQAADLAHGDRHDELEAEALAYLVQATLRTGEAQRGYQWSARALAAVRRTGDRPQPRTIALLHRGRLHAQQREFDDAVADLEAGLAALERDADAPWRYRATLQHALANARLQRREYAAARALYEQALALYAQLGESHPDVARLKFDIGVLDLNQGHHERARATFEEVLRTRVEALGELHPEVGEVYLALANIDQQRGTTEALARADEEVTAGIRIFRDAFGPDHPKLINSYQLLNAICYRREDHAGALAAATEMVRGLVVRLGDDHLDVAYARGNLAENELMVGRPGDALASIDTVLQRHALPPDLLAFARGVRGRALFALARAAEAVATLEQSVKDFRALGGNPPLELATIQWTLARALAAVDGGKSARARAQASAAVAIWAPLGDDLTGASRTEATAARRWLGAGG